MRHLCLSDIDLLEIDRDPRDDDIDFPGDVMLVDSERNCDNSCPRLNLIKLSSIM